MVQLGTTDFSASRRASRAALSVYAPAVAGIALLLAMAVGDAWAGNCDEVIAPFDTGCGVGETCDASTLTCTSGNPSSAEYVDICHRPPGCPGNARTLSVSACAIAAHLGHGDSLGACPECDSDDDCPAGQVCNVTTNICIDPNGGCDDDADCGGGQVCNTSTGTCIDPGGGCSSDTDCGGGQVCNTSTGTCIDPGGGCDDDTDCGGGQVCNPATGTCQNPSDECSVDSDCDDGSFCNGAETCDRIAGCMPGLPPCDDGIACTVDGCDEGSDSCTHSPSHPTCDDGVFCNGAEICDPASGCVAGAPVECDSIDEFCAAGVCDEAAGSCVLEPRNEGLDCLEGEPDICVLSAACAAGECVITPLCDAECERCDPDGCTSLCGNPFNQNDDVVNSTDALYTLRVCVGLEECSACVCDVDGDGIVTATDTLMILRHVVGLGDVFVCSDGSGAETTTTTSTTLSGLP